MVIGGGPAGMAAALFALRAGARVTLLERNEKLGKKLYITGKGRCNVTNVAQGDDFLAQVPRNPRFLYASLGHLSSESLRALLRELGCDTVAERGGRVFPVAQKASDVTRALARGLQGVDIRLGARVESVQAQPGGGFHVRLYGEEVMQADAVIVATGGLSYPVTGSTGDGYSLARASGHRVTDTYPALVPLETADDWARPLQGLALKNVALTASRRGKTLFHEQGELLFTHFGISGPLVLSMSSLLAGLQMQDIACAIDLKPAVPAQELEQRLARLLAEGGRKPVSSLLPQLMPRSLAQAFPAVCPVQLSKACSQITAAERRQMVDILKALPVRLTQARPLTEAVVTRGGVDVRDVNPSTMMSRLVPGLFFAGEVLDVDAFTGGYNLQIAFSTGALAGERAAQFIAEEKE